MNPMDYVDIGALAFAVVAAAFAAVAARWGWLDRPNHAIRFGIRRQIPTEYKELSSNSEGETGEISVRSPTSGPFTATVRVSFEGDGVLRDVRLAATGTLRLGAIDTNDDVQRSRMATGSEPLKADLIVGPLATERHPPYLEVRWTSMRPLRHHSERINLRTGEIETWKWGWRLGLRKRPHEPWWKKRLVRVSGRWVNARRNPLVEVPVQHPWRES